MLLKDTTAKNVYLNSHNFPVDVVPNLAKNNSKYEIYSYPSIPLLNLFENNVPWSMIKLLFNYLTHTLKATMTL